MSASFVAEQIIADLSIPSQRWWQPIIVGLFGLPCAGKTEVAHHIASRYPLVVLSTDVLRLRYGLSSGPATMDVMEQVARVLSPQRVGLVFDGLHLAQKDRSHLRALAAQLEAHCILIYVTASPDVIVRRLEERLRRPERTVAEGKFVITAHHFSAIAQYLEEPEDNEGAISIDTSKGLTETSLQALHETLAFFPFG